MRVLVQRVAEASVEIDRQIISSIGKGLLVFIGIESTDTCRMPNGWPVKRQHYVFLTTKKEL
jgi:D-Tyr-tRNAtyr deacylase